MTPSRRTVLGSALIAGAAATLTGAQERPAGAAFALNYAPHQDSFRSRGGRLEQVAYAADQGFRGWEDNEAAGRSVAEQEALSGALARRGMTMGVFVASMPRWSAQRPVLGANDDGDRQAFLADVRKSVEVAKRLNAKWATVVTGFVDGRVPHEMQSARVVETMRRAADIVEPHGLVLVMEPLNTLTDHPGVFMRTITQGYAVARAVGSPSVKVLADLYHEQIQAGNLLRTLESCWSEIAYVQFGDNPGRKEPGTGEINYANVVRWLGAKGYRGVIGMEHSNSVPGRSGEERLVAAYRAIDRAAKGGNA
jgi:hydroxypyruvate isomerase